jgi:hypothetical protein
MDVFEGDDLAAGHDDGNTVAKLSRLLTTRSRGRQSPPSQLGQHLSSRPAVTLCQLLRGLEYVVFDVQRGSHASDAIASDAQWRRPVEPDRSATFNANRDEARAGH